MKRSQLRQLFEELTQRPVNALAIKAREEGRRVIGYTCSYVPEPLIGVDGLAPIRTRAPGVAGTPMADTYLSSVICTYTRSLLEFALDGGFAELDGWVFVASCDHMRRLHDNLAYLESPAFNYIIDLPHKLSDPALAWFEEELRMLAGALAADFGVDTGKAALEASIKKHNEFIGILRDIGDTRKLDPPPISGADFHSLIVACASSPKDMIIDAARELRDVLAGSEAEGTAKEMKSPRARLMVVGSQMDDPAYLRVIESMGALVVADRFCLGSIPGLDPIPEEGDPLHALAAHYLRRASCPRMMEEFDTRLAAILAAVKEFRADGIVISTMKFCDCWGVEASLLTTALREAGIPVLRVEREYSLSGEGQLRTRVQAFIESMGK